MCRRNELQDVPVRPVHVSSPQDEGQAPNPTFELAGGLSVRGRLWLIVIAVAVPLLLLLAGIVWWLTEHQRDASRQTLVYAAQSISSAIDSQLGKYIAVVEALAASNSLEMDDLDGFRREAERALLGLPGSWVSLADTHGQQLVNTFVSIGTPLPRLGADSLRDEARAFETGQTQVSDVTIGSVAKSPIIVVGVPVFQAGAPAYYLMIAAHAGVFQDLLNQKHLPNGWVAAVTDRRGNFITRSRDHEDWVGKPASGFASSEGQRLAYESTVSPLSGWAVGVGAEKTILGAPIQRTLFIAAFVGLGVTVSSMLLAAWAARRITVPIKALEASAATLQNNNPVSFHATGVPEVDHALRAFATASTVLRAHTLELHEREAKIRRLVESNVIGIFTWEIPADDPDDPVFVEVNDALLRMLGYDREDFVSGRIRRSDVTPPEWRDRDRRTMVEVRATGVLQPFEKEYFRKDGSRLPVLLGFAAFDETRTRGVGFVLDLTEHKRVENELRQSEAKLEEAQRIAHVGWWERDFTTNRVSLSDEVCRVFGVDPVELPEWHERWLNLIHPEDRSRAAEAAAAAVRGGPRYDVEYRVVRPDGEVRIVHSQGEVTWDDSGRHLRQFGVLQDITELRHAEEEVRASEERFRTFVDHATDAFFLLDDQAIVLDVNRQACHSLGYSREELIGMHPREFDAGLDEPSLEQVRQRLNAGETLTFETRHRRKDGTDFPVEIRGSHFEKGGRRILCLARDITERKKAEEELRASEARFRTFVDYATDAFFLLDDHSTILDVNRQACKGLGYSREELIGSHRSVFDIGLDEPSIQRMRQRVAAGETLTFETRHKRKDGTSFPVEVRVGHLEQGGLRFLCLVRDITERKRAEEALRRSEAYLAEAQRLTRTGSWAWDPQRDKILHCSEEIYRIYGVDARDGVPKYETLLQRIHPEDRDRIRESTLEGVRQKIECLLDYRIVLPDGTLKYIQSIRRPVLDTDGNVVEILATSIDATERKHAEVALRNREAELAHANRLATMGQLTAQIAHEVSQPIGGAAASAEAALLRLASSTPDLEGLRLAIQRVISNTTRARDVIGRVRDLIKKAAPRKDAFDINEAIREVVALTSGEAAKISVKLQTRLEANVPLVEGDRVQVQQVVLNLVVNAIEAMSEVGEGPRELCIISEKSDTDAVLVAVQDSGPGLSPEDRDSLFEAFYTTKPSGLGLGLSICRTIIEAHGGRLNAVANVPRGATFQFTLPTRHDPARGA